MIAFHPTRIESSGTVAQVPVAKSAAVESGGPKRTVKAGRRPGRLSDSDDWLEFAKALPLEGAARQLAIHAQFLSVSPFELRLSIDRGNAHLVTEQLKRRLSAAIQGSLGDSVKVELDICEVTEDTLAARSDKRKEGAIKRAREAIESDPNVQELTDVFGAELVPESVRPLDTKPDDR